MSKRSRRMKRDKVKRMMGVRLDTPRLMRYKRWDPERDKYVMEPTVKWRAIRFGVLLVWIGVGVILVAMVLL